MGFGPFLSKEEKAKINADSRRSQQKNQGLVQGGPGEMITPQEAIRRRRAASPKGMRQYDAEKSNPKQSIRDNFVSDTDYIAPKGQFRGMGQRQRADGKGGWTDVNVVHATQPAVLNGQNVRADGKGNWVNTSGITVGTYKPGKDRTAVSPSSSLKVEDNRTGSVKKPSAYPTEAALTTIKPSRDYQKEASIDLPTDDRNDTRIDSKGNIQKGTITSPKPMTMDDANKLLTGGYKMNQDYASNQLPYTQSSPYAGKSNSQIYNPETLHQHDSDVDYVKLSKDIYGDQSGVESYTRGGEMNKDYKQMDVDLGQSTAGKPEKSIPKRPSGARQAEKWDRKYGGADFSGKSEAPATSGFDMERRAAFLGAKTSMEGLRRSEATQNMAYRNGDYFIGDGKGGENLIKLENKEDRLTYKSGKEGARQIRDKYVNALTSKGDSVEYQTDAPAPLPGAVPGNTNIDKSQLDTSDLMDMNPSESIIGNNTPSRTVKKGTLFNR